MEVAPDGPATETTLPGEEAGHLFGFQDPDSFEIGEVLQETYRPIRADNGQPFNVLVIEVERMVGNPHPCPFPLGKCDKSATLRHPTKPYLILHGTHTYSG